MESDADCVFGIALNHGESPVAMEQRASGSFVGQSKYVDRPDAPDMNAVERFENLLPIDVGLGFTDKTNHHESIKNYRQRSQVADKQRRKRSANRFKA